MRLGRSAAHVLGPGALRSLTDLELDAVTLAQIVESLAVNGALVEEILFPGIVLDEPETLVLAVSESCLSSFPPVGAPDIRGD